MSNSWSAMSLFLWSGDPAVTLGYVWALMLVQGAFRLNKSVGKNGILADIAVAPLLYWLAGPLSILYVGLRIAKLGTLGCVHLLYIASIDNNGNVTKPFLLPQRNPRVLIIEYEQ